MTLVRVIPRNRRDTLGEGPLWSPRDKAVYWVDILGWRLNRFLPDSERVDEWVMPDAIGWVIERANGGFMAGLGCVIAAVSIDAADVRISLAAAVAPTQSGLRLNDAKADAHGRIWAGTMPMRGQTPVGALYRFDPDGTLACLDRGYHIANGPALSPDGRWLYHTDSHVRTVFRFPLHDDGSLGAREVFRTFDPDWGAPDGMTFDADGGLWIAHWGAGCVSRFDPQAKRERWIDLPASQITSCTFAGARLDRMYVTSAADGVDEKFAGSLFEVAPGCVGLPAYQFGG